MVIAANNDSYETAIIHIYIGYSLDNINFNTLSNFEQSLLEKIKITGYANIFDSFDEKITNLNFKNNSDITQNSGTQITTEGENMIDIRNIKYIDFTKTYTNVINQMYNIFGIEVARKCIIYEIQTTLAFNGLEINDCHLELLADFMTNNGVLTSINRHGINKLDTEPLSRASFEESLEQLVKASVFTERDNIKSVSSNIIVGNLIQMGTGICDLKIDIKALQETLYVTSYIKNNDFIPFKKIETIVDILSKI